MFCLQNEPTYVKQTTKPESAPQAEAKSVSASAWTSM